VEFTLHPGGGKMVLLDPPLNGSFRNVEQLGSLWDSKKHYFSPLWLHLFITPLSFSPPLGLRGGREGL
jgi:hypothetical protein